ncbi:MAG TPA: DUF2061 domain-containing protein [Bacteroidales bacterium]|nr:DUF2061 domain-containing protein [Bacteroidales bacterium]
MIIDSPLRSLIKGISWRIVASFDTFVLAFIVTSRALIAAPIAASEILTKIVLYFLHERLWNLITWGRSDNKPTAIRSLAKSMSWRIWGTIDTIILSYFISGNIHFAITIGSLEVFTKILFFFVHERIWAQIKWGRKIIKTVEHV